MKERVEFKVIKMVPFVSVIFPIRNEISTIEKGLHCIFVQRYPKERFEVIVVDGMSDDGTRELVHNIIVKNPQISVYMVDNPRHIVPTALNLGISQAKGDIIVRVDGHTLITPDYISESVSTLMRTGADNVGGLMTPLGYGWRGETIALAHNLRFGLGGGLFHYSTKETEADTVYMGCFRRDVFTRVGFFDEDLVRNQDIELNGRIRQAGGRIVLSPRIRSTYFCRKSLVSLWHQNFANGLWLFPTVAKNPAALSWRHYVPFVFISTLIGCGIISLFVNFGWITFVIVFGSYMIATCIASLTAAYRYGWRFALSLPIVFFILHISYGLGTLVGLYKSVTHHIQRFSPKNLLSLFLRKIV